MATGKEESRMEGPAARGPSATRFRIAAADFRGTGLTDGFLDENVPGILFAGRRQQD